MQNKIRFFSLNIIVLFAIQAKNNTIPTFSHNNGHMYNIMIETMI